MRCRRWRAYTPNPKAKSRTVAWSCCPASEAASGWAGVTDPGAAAASVFGPRLDVAVRYAELLRGPGVVRGLIGPREADRLWDRHLLNCAVLGEVVPSGSSVLDVGSGAGLPGLPLAIARPDLTVTLLEPMARRIAFLHETVAGLGLTGVRVVRGRAEDGAVRRTLGRFPVVTARAVAPLGRLAGWCLPLLAPGGQLLALKGSSAEAELAAAGGELQAADVQASVLRCGLGVLPTPTTVVRLFPRARATR